MLPIARARLVAVVLALAAAFGWSTYYLFVLWVTPGTAPSAVIVYPFAAGAVAYGLWAQLRGRGRELLQTWREAGAYLRTALLLGMQFSVLAATYLTGPVDASLLSLLGDVVATPLVVAWWVAERRRELARPAFALGLVLSVAGGSLAIAGGQSLGAIHDVGWLVVPIVPLVVAFYFVLSARAGERLSYVAVVGQSMIAATVAAALLAPLVPGGWGGLIGVRPLPLALLLTNGLVSFFVAPLLYFRAIEKAGLVLPPMLMTGIPVFTLLLSAGVLGISIPLVGLLGIPLAVAGGIVALRASTA